jgi:two-component system sensor histidine kinase KdpD
MRGNRLSLRLLIIYLLPPVLTVLTGIGLSFIRENASMAVFALIFLVPVALSAVWWGLGPGIMAAVTGFLAFNYFFIKPYSKFIVHNPGDWVVLGAFLGAAILISELVGRARSSMEQASARELETFRLYQLSGQLAAAQDESHAAQMLAQKTREALNAQQVDVFIEGNPPIEARASQDGKFSSSKPNLLTPVETSRGLLGEIRIWSAEDEIRGERFLKTAASQMALIIERLRLAEAARKTRVVEENDRFKSLLLSSVSHELRSPLAAIKASISSLRSGEVEWDSEARAELLETVEEEIDHLNVLVGNLLDMSRIESGALRPEKKPNVLSEIVGAAVKRMKLPAQNHHIRVEVSDELPLVSVDFLLMEQVFINLLTNSLKYSPPGSQVLISAREKDARNLQVSVSNHSLPLPETDLERVFDKFYRINPSERVTGSGLGLSICKGIVDAHGGTIWAENRPDGVTFHFTVAKL